MPEYQDQFIETALEEFIIIELHFEQEHGLGTAFFNAIYSTVFARVPRDDAKSSRVWNAARECRWISSQYFLPPRAGICCDLRSRSSKSQAVLLGRAFKRTNSRRKRNAVRHEFSLYERSYSRRLKSTTEKSSVVHVLSVEYKNQQGNLL